MQLAAGDNLFNPDVGACYNVMQMYGGTYTYAMVLQGHTAFDIQHQKLPLLNLLEHF